MTIERGMELLEKSSTISNGLVLESLAATASGDTAKAKYIVQEHTVLNKITKAIAAVTMAKLLHNEEG